MAALSILNDDQIRSIAPSVFQNMPYHKMSDRFAHVPTFEALPILRDLGYHVVGVRRNNTRIIDKREYVGHSIDFAKSDAIARCRDVGAEFPILTIGNGHDGSSCLVAMSGVYTVICSNTARRCDSLNSFKVKHLKKNGFEQAVNEALELAIRQSERFYNELQEWKKIELTPAQSLIYSEGATRALGIDVNPAVLAAPTNHLERGTGQNRQLSAVYQSIQGRTKRGEYRHSGTGRKARVVGSMSRQDEIDTILADYTARIAATLRV